MPVLVALGSIPRKKVSMVNTPEVELSISTGKINKADSPLYYITVEVVSASNIVADLFVMELKDTAVNSYSYSRVASLQDIQLLGTSSITENSAYRASAFTVETNSLSYIKELREGVQLVMQRLLDQASEAENFGLIDQVTTVTLRGGN